MKVNTRTGYRYNKNLARKGFTLIELLVVIAIIALLAVILFPVFARARENSRRTACMNNERQIALGILQYFQDFDEFGPCGLDAGDQAHPWNNGQGWASQVYPYVKVTGLFMDPDDPNPQMTSSGSVPVDYGYNENLEVGITNNAVASPLAAMTQPAKTIMLTEGYSPSPYKQTYYITTGETIGDTSPTCNGNYFANGWRPSNSGTAYCMAGLLGDTGFLCGGMQELANCPTTGIHFTGSNFAFFDGHVKWLMGSQVSPGGNPSSPNSTQSIPGRTAAGSNGTFENGTPPQGTYSVR